MNFRSANINLGGETVAESLFDKLNPFNRVVDRAADLVDKVVVDKDAKIQVQGKLEELRLMAQQQIESSYQVALQTKTIPLIDGIHKLARPIMGMITLYVNNATVEAWAATGTTMTSVHVSILAIQWGPTGLYTAIKGRGKP